MDESQQDLGVLDDIDPSLDGGFKIQFNKEINIETRIQNANTGPQEIGTLEQIQVKILVQGDQQAFENLKIELTSETDLFFNYISMYFYSCKLVLTKKTLKKQKKNRNLLQSIRNSYICQQNYQVQVIRNLISINKQKQISFFCVFFMQQDGAAKLDFIENLEYKFMEMLSLEFSSATEETIRQNISFRYNFMKAKLQFVQNRLNDITSLIKLKNPSLLAQLNKVSMSSNQSQSNQNVSKIMGQSRKNNNSSKFI